VLCSDSACVDICCIGFLICAPIACVLLSTLWLVTYFHTYLRVAPSYVCMYVCMYVSFYVYVIILKLMDVLFDCYEGWLVHKRCCPPRNFLEKLNYLSE
jgi:hypothetical protein